LKKSFAIIGETTNLKLANALRQTTDHQFVDGEAALKMLSDTANDEISEVYATEFLPKNNGVDYLLQARQQGYVSQATPLIVVGDKTSAVVRRIAIKRGVTEWVDDAGDLISPSVVQNNERSNEAQDQFHGHNQSQIQPVEQGSAVGKEENQSAEKLDNELETAVEASIEERIEVANHVMATEQNSRNEPQEVQFSQSKGFGGYGAYAAYRADGPNATLEPTVDTGVLHSHNSGKDNGQSNDFSDAADSQYVFDDTNSRPNQEKPLPHSNLSSDSLQGFEEYNSSGVGQATVDSLTQKSGSSGSPESFEPYADEVVQQSKEVEEATIAEDDGVLEDESVDGNAHFGTPETTVENASYDYIEIDNGDIFIIEDNQGNETMTRLTRQQLQELIDGQIQEALAEHSTVLLMASKDNNQKLVEKSTDDLDEKLQQLQSVVGKTNQKMVDVEEQVADKVKRSLSSELSKFTESPELDKVVQAQVEKLGETTVNQKVVELTEKSLDETMRREGVVDDIAELKRKNRRLKLFNWVNFLILIVVVAMLGHLLKLWDLTMLQAYIVSLQIPAE
jgi:hypothetical protein